MISIEPHGITIERVFPEKELWRYHIGTVVNELALAGSVEEIGYETLFGRETIILGLMYDDSADEEYLLWIDTDTYLPVRKVFYHPDGSTLVVEFTELDINPDLNTDIFSWEVPAGVEYRESNKTLSLEELTVSVWPEAGKTVEAVTENSDFELSKSGILKNDLYEDLYEGILRFRDKKSYEFLDIYYTSTPQKLFFDRQSVMGSLGSGYAELNSNAWNLFDLYIGRNNMGRWIGEDEIVIVSNTDLALIRIILEELAGEPIQVMSYNEIVSEGFELPIEKDGH